MPEQQTQQETIAALRQAVEHIESQPAAPPTADASDQAGETAGETAGSRPREQSAYDAARQVVLRRLTGSAKSRHQLAETLREKEFDEAVASAVLDRMEEVGLVDDASFAWVWVRTRHETKGLGSAALRRELKDRGVAEALIDDALTQLSVENEEAAARDLLERKLGNTVIPGGAGREERRERDKHARRLVSMLGRRGHSSGQAVRLVREALEERQERLG